MTRLDAALKGDLRRMMAQEQAAAEAGIRGGMERGQDMAKSLLRHQVQRAGLGQRLAKTWRGDRKLLYRDGPLDYAALVVSKAPKIIAAHMEGGTVHAKQGRFLAIPTKTAQRAALRRRRAKPKNFPFLRYVRREDGADLLIDPRVPRTRSGKLSRKAVYFMLVEQITLRKSLPDFREVQRRVGAILPRLILDGYKTTPVKESI